MTQTLPLSDAATEIHYSVVLLMPHTESGEQDMLISTEKGIVRVTVVALARKPARHGVDSFTAYTEDDLPVKGEINLKSHEVTLLASTTVVMAFGLGDKPPKKS